jgi:benzoate membrane transport protein
LLTALRRDFSASALAAGFVAVMVSYAGPLAIVVQAAKAGGLGDAALSSWIWAISIGSGVTGILLSLRTRTPVITAWSTPGAALLVAALPLFSYSEAVGAYLLSSALIVVFGTTGLFSKVMDRIPAGIVAAMLAGILFKFAINVCMSISAWASLVLPLVFVFYCARRWLPRYAVMLTLALGMLIIWRSGSGGFALSALQPQLAVPVFTRPAFSMAALVGLGLPLFLVTMTSQNATGLGVMRTAGYNVPGDALVTATGIASLLLAPFGCHAINLAAITAAICTGPEAHAERARRYVAGVACGAFYIVVGAFGATIALAFSRLPDALIATVAGLALVSALTTGLASAMREERTREGAIATFVVTASGVSFLGVGAAFWGLAAGSAIHLLMTTRSGARAVEVQVRALDANED